MGCALRNITLISTPASQRGRRADEHMQQTVKVSLIAPRLHSVTYSTPYVSLTG